MPAADDLVDRINAIARLTGTFTLRSGQVAGEYFDKYRFEADPVLLDEIAAGLVTLLPDGTEVLAGLELGGVPIATALCLRTGLPVAFVRKQAKAYGTAAAGRGRRRRRPAGDGRGGRHHHRRPGGASRPTTCAPSAPSSSTSSA